MKKYVSMKCLGGRRMRNPFRTVREIAEHVTRVFCPDEPAVWLYLHARRYLRADISYGRFERELGAMVRAGVLRRDVYDRYSRT